jgi:hypothetical protein
MPLLQFLPYALAAYGGYKGYQASKQAGGSGIQRLLGGVTGATLGYYGGKAGLAGGAQFKVPGFEAAQAAFKPFTETDVGTSLSKYLPMTKDAPQGDDKRNMLQKLLQRKRYEDGVFTGEYELDPMKAALGVGGLSYLSGAFEQKPVDLFQPTYNLAYGEFAEKRPDFRYIDPETGQEKVYDKVYIPEQDRPANAERLGPYEISRNRFKTGGLADIKKFNEGGINYLPSKVSHDENDANNYVKASGYVEDGSGNGDKDEDTMLAQLADGEFVTRADGVLGAGIIAGANPKSIKDMREKGAKFFYEQQARYKRVFDLIKESNEAKQKN